MIVCLMAFQLTIMYYHRHYGTMDQHVITVTVSSFGRFGSLNRSLCLEFLLQYHFILIHTLRSLHQIHTFPPTVLSMLRPN